MSETLTMIPLSRLQRSKENTRKTEPSADVDALAASIAAHGLLQNLTVRPVRAGDGASDGRYEVVAGARRLEALKLLVKRRRIPKNTTVPCAVLSENRASGALEFSLAENVMRVPLHPADQFDAFSALQAQGQGAEEIAGRFGVTAMVVLQRLKLAAVSPKLMEVYREGGMSLDQLTAFTISDDHAAQEHVWFDSPLHDRTPHGIRRALTRTLVEGADRRARFIGAGAYEQAGGRIVRDLFKEVDEGYFEDEELLDRLVADKLAAEADMVKAEGWNWVETLVEMDYGHLARFRHLPGEEVPLSEEEQAKLNELSARYDEMVAELNDEPEPEAVAELDRISAEIDALSARRVQWSEEDKARAGVLVSLDYNGNLLITRGLVKPEPRAEERKKTSKAATATAGGSTSGEVSEPAQPGGLSDALLEDLSAHRTAALRETLAADPDGALSALVHALVLRIFFAERETCIGVRLEPLDLRPFADGIGESPALVAMAERHRSWSEQLPEKDELWSWLERQGRDARLELLAYCTALCLHAVRQRHFGEQRERLEQSELIARAVHLDMARWWRPTRKAYLDRVTKQQILTAVAEGRSPQEADKLASLKKDAMAARAEELLADTTWLPEPLRLPGQARLEPDAVTSE